MEGLLPAYKSVGDKRYRETSGLCYEDFTPGDVFEHRPGRTVLDVDNRLYEHIDGAEYRQRLELFSAWFEHPIDLPGPWTLQVVDDLFRNNLFFESRFTALGEQIGLHDVTCPTYLLAGEHDDITPAPQVLEAFGRLGTPSDRIVKGTVPGGHVGLFMAHRTVHDTWPKISRWMRELG